MPHQLRKKLIGSKQNNIGETQEVILGWNLAEKIYLRSVRIYDIFISPVLSRHNPRNINNDFMMFSVSACAALVKLLDL